MSIMICKKPLIEYTKKSYNNRKFVNLMDFITIENNILLVYRNIKE